MGWEKGDEEEMERGADRVEERNRRETKGELRLGEGKGGEEIGGLRVMRENG